MVDESLAVITENATVLHGCDETNDLKNRWFLD